MGFPVGCSDQLLPKLLLYLLFSISQLRELISKALTLIGLLRSSSTTTNYHHYHYCGTKLRSKPHFAVLIQEILPVVPYSDFSPSSEEERCMVCLYEFEGKEEVRRLSNCSHAFHRCCLDPWIELDQRTCPLCRMPLVPIDIQESFDRKLRESESADDDWDLLLSSSSRCIFSRFVRGE